MVLIKWEDILQNARELRKSQTKSENLLWQSLRNRKLNNYKFLRQHPIGGFIVDFYCWKEKLALELDGGIHQDPAVKERDLIRQNFLEQNGITILRFENNTIFNDLPFVLEKILCVLEN